MIHGMYHLCVPGRKGEKMDMGFQRTIRVPDNDITRHIFPSMGTLPTYSIGQFDDTLPREMMRKGGLLIPMYRMSKSFLALSALLRLNTHCEQNVRPCGSSSEQTIALP